MNKHCIPKCICNPIEAFYDDNVGKEAFPALVGYTEQEDYAHMVWERPVLSGKKNSEKYFWSGETHA
jgi:hypothetical protein